MYRITIASAFIIGLSACKSETETAEFTPPVIDSFEILQNGEVILNGSGLNALKDVDETFNFSVSMHKDIGESSFIAFGSKPEVKDDKTLILKPSQLDKAQLYVRNEKEISDSMRAILTPEWNGKSTTLDIPKAKLASVIGRLASGNTNCTLWLDMKDPKKVFWDPKAKDNTFTMFGHYELYNYKKGNQSGYNRKKLEYMTRTEDQY